MTNYDELKKAAELATELECKILALLAEREKLLKVVEAAKTVSQSLNAPSLRDALKELEK